MDDLRHGVTEPLASSETDDGEFWGQFVGKVTEDVSDPQGLAASAVAEIDTLMGDLASAREYLMAEAERVRRETERLKNLSKTAMASVLIISDNLKKLQQNGNQAVAELAVQKSKQDEGADAAQGQKGKHDEGAKVAEVQGRRGKVPAVKSQTPTRDSPGLDFIEPAKGE